MDEHIFVLLYKSIVRPHVEFGNSVWCPFKLGDIEEIEKIQKRATKLIISLKNKPYKERLMIIFIHQVGLHGRKHTRNNN